MVNGNLQWVVRQEIFAGCAPFCDLFCPAGGQHKTPKLLNYIDLLSWHGFCTFPCAAAWESCGRRRSSLWRRPLRCSKGESTDGECTSRRPVTADGARS